MGDSARDPLSRVAVVMPSCDRYASLWPLSLGALQRCWPQRPARTVLIANARPCSVEGVQQVLVGEDRGWSGNLLRALPQVHEEYVFLAIDDLVMMPGTDGALLSARLRRAVQERWNYLRVNPQPGPPAAGADGLGVLPPGDAYRTAVVWSLWRKRVLQALLVDGESAWAFEKPGSARSDRFGRWWACATPAVDAVNLVTAGQLEPRALARVRAAGWPVQALEFAPMRPVQALVHRARLLRSQGLRCIPRPWRRAVLHRLRPAP